VGASGGDAGSHPFTFGNLLINGKVEVRVRPANANDVLLGALNADLAPLAIVDLGIILGNEFLNPVHLTGINEFLVVTTDDRLVLFCRHLALPRIRVPKKNANCPMVFPQDHKTMNRAAGSALIMKMRCG
jgi:hypothetical protein